MMPLRRGSLPKGPDMQWFRKASHGRLAEFFVLDTRQYRTDQPNGDGLKPLNDEALRPSNTLLGKTQRSWLDAGLTASAATWNVLAQQVMMAMIQPTVRDKTGCWMDQWPGAAYERMDLAKLLVDRKIANPIVLTGDNHSNRVNDLRVDDRILEMPVVATEFVGTSLSSGGNGPKKFKNLDKLTAADPRVKHHGVQRGYVRCVVTPRTWTSDYVVVDDVTKPGGKSHNDASFTIEAGVRGAKRV